MNGAEWFDVVNSMDEAVASSTRAYVHGHGLRHRSVHIFVYRPDCEEVYLQKRSAAKDKHPRKWDTSCAGHVDRGEIYDVAAWRELKEELCLSKEAITKWQPLFKVDSQPETGFEFIQVYAAATQVAPDPDPIEIELGKWISFQDLNDWIINRPEELTPDLRVLWPRVSRLLRS